ncbi:helix-turn-helix domain-containing protein [candidate division GN15 bacterium]|nr:helix-turn-helix domain-containing protein [candidate division GN15 bacterium]
MYTGTNSNVTKTECLGDRLDTLRQNVAKWADRSCSLAPKIPGVFLFRREAVSAPETVMYEPCVCFLAQGAKRVYPGHRSFVYDSRHFLAAAVNIPTVVQVIEASPEKPCLGIVLAIDRREVSQLLLDGKIAAPRSHRAELGISAGEVTPKLLDAVCRLVDLYAEPSDIPALAPMIKREILYRLLTGDFGRRLWQVATAGSQSHQISEAIHWLKENFDQRLRVDKLAERVNMSTSTFHHHFRAMTARSPLQFQKWLRLNEARRLMLVERLGVSDAAFQVGYESVSQFSRDYSRLFGDAPTRDIAVLRQKIAASPN